MEGLYEAAFAALLRGSDDLVLVIDREGRILDAGALAQARLAGAERLPGSNVLDRLSGPSGRALRDLLDALGTDGAITVEHVADVAGAADLGRVRYAVHALPGAGGHRDYLLVGRQVAGPATEAEGPDPAAIDPLTGLANRGGMADGLARLWSACQHDPAGAVAWVMMADIDAFKSVNDTYGHAAGDEVLAAVGMVLANSVRAGDLVARYGGDEFLLAGGASGHRDVERIAARVVEAVRALELTPVGCDQPVRVTISVGAVLAAPAPDCPERDAIAAADRALYRAKAAGRDRVEIEPDLLGG